MCQPVSAADKGGGGGGGGGQQGQFAPGANFYLTHPFLDLVSGRSSNWHSAHARVGGVQPLNLEANLEMALFGVSNFERRFWSCLSHAWDSRGLYKASAVTICIASLPWG